MVYFKYSCPVRGTRRVYLYERSLKAVNGIIEFEDEPSPRLRIGLGMRGYKRVADDAAKALHRTEGDSGPSAKPSEGSTPKDGQAPQTPPQGDSGGPGLLSQLGKAISGKGRKSSKEK